MKSTPLIVFIASACSTLATALLLLLASAAPRVDAAMPGTWHLPPEKPVGRAEFGMACTPDLDAGLRVYVVGGRNAKGGVESSYYFDVANLQWNKVNDGSTWDSNIVAPEISVMLTGEGDYEVLAIAGRDVSTTKPSAKAQVLLEDGWRVLDATNADEMMAEPAEAFWVGTWEPRAGHCLDYAEYGCRIWSGGITKMGFTRELGMILWNKTEGMVSARWQHAQLRQLGKTLPGTTAGTDFPRALYGACCAHDPSTTPNVKNAYCFGGQDYLDDSNTVWKYEFTGPGGGWTKMTSPTGDIPTKRRNAACAFVAQNKFLIWGGFDGQIGTTVNDNAAFEFDVVTKAWTKRPNNADLNAAWGGKMVTCTYKTNNTKRTYLFGGQKTGDTFNDELFVWDSTANKFVIQPVNDEFVKVAAQPDARAYHSSASFRSEIYAFNGIDKDGVSRNDGFIYSPTTKNWEQFHLDAESSVKSWTARHGSAHVLVGGLLYIIGGYSSVTKTPLYEMLAVDLEERQATRVPDSDFDATPGAAPNGRYFGAAAQQGNEIVFTGGKDASGSIRNGFHAFSVTDQSWEQLFLDGSPTTHAATKHLARFGHTVGRVNSTHAVFGLGFSGLGQAFYELFWLHEVDAGAKSFKLQAFDMSPIASKKRDYVRAFAGVSTNQFGMFVCGGIVAEAGGISPPRHTACYMINFATNVWADLALGQAAERWILAAPTVHFIEKSIFIVFGQRTNGVAVTAEFNEQVSEFRFNTGAICAAGVTSGCQPCPLGYVQPQCTPVQKGYYVDDATKAPKACPSGTYNNYTGATSSTFCLPCPVGTFNNQVGQSLCTKCTSGVCPIGSAAALSETSPRAIMITHIPTDSHEEHPAAYESPSVPLFPVVFISSLVGIITFVLIFMVCVARSRANARKYYYLTAGLEEQLQEYFDQYATGRYGMTEENFMLFIVQEREFLPEHIIDVGTADLLFRHADRHARFHELYHHQFIDAMCTAIEYGYMTPFAGTEAATQGRRMPDSGEDPEDVPFYANMRLEQLDYFEDSHSIAQAGESERYFSSWYGGVITLVMIVALVALIAVTVLDFALNSHTETKSSVPRAVIYSSFSADMTVYAPVIVQVSYWGLLRSSQGVNSIKDACLDNSAGAAPNKCAAASVTHYGFSTRSSTTASTGSSVPGEQMTCEYNAREEGCTVTWTCPSCHIGDGANMTVLVSPAIAAPIIRSRFSTGTGIHKPTQSWLGTIDIAGDPTPQLSHLDTFLRPEENSTLFSGQPASVFSYGLAPTYFEADSHLKLVFIDEVIQDTGYHVRQASPPVRGMAVPPSLFERYYDVPVVMKFTVDTTPVLVKRTAIATVVTLLTGLLGAVSGLIGVFVSLVQFADERGENENQEEEERLRDVDAHILDDYKRREEEMKEQQIGGGDDTEPTTAAVDPDDPTALPPSPPKKKPRAKKHQRRKPQTSGADFDKLSMLMHSGLSLAQAEAVVNVIYDLALQQPQQGGGFPGAAVPLTLDQHKMQQWQQQQQMMQQQQQQQQQFNGGGAGSGHFAAPSGAGGGAQAMGGTLNPFGLHQSPSPPAEAPSAERLNAPDYAIDESVNTSGLFFSATANMFWDEAQNTFLDVASGWWFNPNNSTWNQTRPMVV